MTTPQEKEMVVWGVQIKINKEKCLNNGYIICQIKF